MNYDEFKAVWTGFAAVHTKVNMNLYDHNENNVLDANELLEWKVNGEKMMEEWGWEITDEMKGAFQRMWIETDIDRNYSSRNFIENINFFLLQWEYLIRN